MASINNTRNSNGSLVLRVYSAMFWSLRSRWPDDGSAFHMLRLVISGVMATVILIVFEATFGVRLSLFNITGRWARIDTIVVGVIIIYSILYFFGPSAADIASIRDKRRLRWSFAIFGWMTLLLMLLGIPYLLAQLS